MEKNFIHLLFKVELKLLREESGRTYLTARTTNLACTFNEITCKSLIGTQLPGQIRKVEVDPYDYTDRTTGEIVEMTHRYEYLSDEDAIINDNVIKPQEVY